MKKLVLEKQENSKKSSHALAGANIRKELKHRYPNCKFKVTTKSYTGGDSVRVSWFDGVTNKEVDAIIDKYTYGNFDGMYDIYEYDSDHNGTYGEVKYAFAERKYSRETMQEAVNYYGYDIKVLVNDYDNSAYIDTDFENTQRVYNYLQDKSFYIAAKKQELKDDPKNEEIYNDGTVEDFTHTKTKKVLKVLKVAHKLSKNAFKSFSKYMKQERGAYYSRYAGGFVLQS